MPILCNSGMGASGYSGKNFDILPTEIFSQPTFTPAYDKWGVDGDFSFVGNVATYNTNTNEYGDLWQNLDDLSTPLKEDTTYQLIITFQNIVIGDLLISCYFDDSNIVDFIPQNGENIFIIKSTSFDGDYPITLYADGTTGSFEVVSVSLKEGVMGGDSGYSGVEGVSGFENPIGANITPADADTIVTQFNALLTSLKNAGIMEEPPV